MMTRSEYIFNLYRLPLSLSKNILEYIIKDIFHIKADPDEREALNLLTALISLKGRCEKEGPQELMIHLASGLDMQLRRYPSSDSNVFCDVWEKKQYQPVVDLMKRTIGYNDQITIMDAGGNIGCTGLYFKKEFPSSHVMILEPEFSNFSLLKRNIELNKCKDIAIVHAGLWKGEAYVEIQKDFRDGREWTYYMKEVPCRTELKGFGVLDMMKQYRWEHIDLLKIDIEGGERYLFEDEKQASRFLSKTRFIAMEIHDEFNIRAKINNCLSDNGFEYFTAGELTIGRNKSIT